ncbi:MAG TPA: hypothetical protein VM818_03820 [Vicinamibacterales bacterium]|nr:hypothetical protein [Vicinamibacterales bacterium]
MPRFGSRILLAVGLLLAAGACGSDDESVTGPPPTTSVNETFSGVLTLNGARVHSFTVTAPGSIDVVLTSLTPNNRVGLNLGTWNGSICQIVLFNDNATQGSVTPGQTTATGTFCVVIHDVAGTVVEPQTYVIDVSYQVSNQ